MGSVGSTDQSCIIIHKMKFLAVAVALVAAVSADADADAFYGYYGYPYAYGVHAFAGKSAPCVNAANVPVPCAGAPYAYSGYPYGLGYGLGYAAYGAYPYAYGAGIAATNAALGHAVAYTPAGVTHSSNVGVCTNYLGAQVPS